MMHSGAIWNNVLEDGSAEKTLKTRKENGAFWRYLKQCSWRWKCWENDKSKDGKWCILALFETYFRKLFSKYFSAVPNRFKYRKNACFRYIVFNYISEVLNRFKYRHNACFRCTLFSSISLQFQIVSDTIIMHALETLFSRFSLQFQIVSNTIRMHALETLFSKCSLK